MNYHYIIKNTYELLILQHHFISNRLNQSLTLSNIRERKAYNNVDLTSFTNQKICLLTFESHYN